MTAVCVHLSAASADDYTKMTMDTVRKEQNLQVYLSVALTARKVTPEDILLRARAKNDYFWLAGVCWTDAATTKSPQ